MSETTLEEIHRRRGVSVPCEQCDGLGAHMYSSGATWRGGMGTASFEPDVCDVCWGSGDAHRHGADLRAMTAQRDAWDDGQAVAYLSRSIGLRYTDTAARVEMLAALADKEANRRKLPDGADAFWWARGWESLASTLRRLAKGAAQATEGAGE